MKFEIESDPGSGLKYLTSFPKTYSLTQKFHYKKPKFRILTFISINSVTQGTKKAPNSCMIFWAKARQLDRPSVLHTSTTITECILDHPFNGSVVQNPPLLPEQLSNIIVQHIGGIGKTESSN